MRLTPARKLLWMGLLGILGGLYCAYAAQTATGQSKLTIEQAVAEALQNNLTLLAERVNIDIAEAQMITARLRPNPIFSSGGDHLDLLRPKFTEDNGGGPMELNFRTDFTLERAGKRQRRIDVARESRSVAEFEVLDASRKIVLNTQEAFVEALLAKDTLALARENLESLNRIVEINTIRFKAGDISNVELIRSRLAALQSQNTVRQSELRLRTALTSLSEVIGRPASQPVTEVDGELRRELYLSTMDELQENAKRLRPDLLALQRNVARATAESRLQMAEAKYDYTVGTEYRRQQGINGKSNSVGFFIEAPLPFFNRNEGEIARARQEQRQAELRVRAQERTIAAEIETAFRQYETARDLLRDIENTMLEQARNVRDITDFSYRRGDATLLELLDAQRTFNETMQSYHDARAEYARALYILDSVSGKAVNP